jgi:glycosyltransferase involved in cell wall biosynthesis
VGSDLLWSPENIGPLGVKRHVITVHDLAALDHPQWFHPAFVALYCLYLPRLVHQVERILTVSEYSRCRLLDRFSIAADRVTVIPCGIAQSFQPCSAPIVQQMKERYGITTPYVLSLGSLDPRKNLRTLLQAWKLLGKDLQQSLTLVIAGDKNRIFADPGYQDRLHNLTGVIFTGYFPEPDLPALYSGALCLVYPSLYEGFGLPPLEAMACGTTVITSETTSLPEVVGDAGILIDPTQPEAIAAAIQLLVQNPAYGHELGQNGLIQAQRFSWDRSAAAVDQVLREI